jgi:hypothetical protein
MDNKATVTVRMSEGTSELFAALSKCQADIKAAKKSADNPFFKSKYADLAEIISVTKDDLAANDLAVVQMPSGIGGAVGLTTLVTHKSGQWLASYYEMTPKDQTPQGYGSAITYMRRYAMGSVLKVATEADDDGNGASGKKSPVKPTTSDDFEI